jgi:hypothetical protein
MHSNQTAQVERGGPPDSEVTVSLSRLVQALRAYRRLILLSMLGLAVVYTIVALVLFLIAPAQRTTSVPFRLDFEGAARAEYPNGLRFSPVEIVGAPVLLSVYNANHLERFLEFGAFSRAVFVLESNPDYEKLAADYQASLADPKLTTVDRDRVEREFALRRESLAKNEYAISYLQTRESSTLPEQLVYKVLGDVLVEWANYAVKEEHGLDYRISVLSPQVLDEASLGAGDYIARIEILRAKVYQTLDNIADLERVPGAELARTGGGSSLREIRLRLEEITRFELEPLVVVVRSSGLIANPTATVRFLQSQLAFDQRRLQTAQAEADAIRQAMALYFGERQLSGVTASSSGAPATDPQKHVAGAGSGETVMPQLSDTFLDRLVALTSRSNDAPDRRKLIADYRIKRSRAIAIEQEVAYDRQVLRDVQEAPAGGVRTDPAAVQAQITAARTEVRQLVVRMNELYATLSRNTSPSKQLFTRTGTPVTRIERARSARQLALYGAVILLLGLPVIVLGCLAHHRVREEQAARVRSATGSGSAG